MNQAAISVKDLSLTLGGHQVLDNISFTINQGDLTYILGANGSGKSTLVKAILGLINYDQGKIEIMGKESTQDIVSRYVGYVPQYSKIDRNFPISVQEMIDLECTYGDNCHVGAAGHLAFLDSQHLVKRKISNLSGGEFQKVLIARAFVKDPQIMIFDEPINNLDHNSQDELLRLLKKINEENSKTVIIISHDHQIINRRTDRILYLSNHKVLSGDTEEILAKHLSNPEHKHD